MPIDPYTQRTTAQQAAQPRSQAPRLGSYGAGLESLSRGALAFQERSERLQREQNQLKARQLQIQDDAARVQTATALPDLDEKMAERIRRVREKTPEGAEGYAAAVREAVDEVGEAWAAEGGSEPAVRFRRDVVNRMRMQQAQEAEQYETQERERFAIQGFVTSAEAAGRLAATNPDLAFERLATLTATLDGISPHTIGYAAQAKIRDAMASTVSKTALQALVQSEPLKAEQALKAALAGEDVDPRYSRWLGMADGDDLIQLAGMAEREAEQARNEASLARAAIEADALFGSSMDPTAVAAHLRDIQRRDPKHASRVRSLYNSLENQAQAAEADTNRQYVESMQDDIIAAREDGNLSAEDLAGIEAKIARAPANKQRALRAMLHAGVHSEHSDIKLWTRLNHLKDNNPEAFRDMDLSQVATGLSRGDYRTLVDAQLAVQRGAGDGPLSGESLLNSLVINRGIEALGYNPTSEAASLTPEQREAGRKYLQAARRALAVNRSAYLQNPDAAKPVLDALLTEVHVGADTEAPWWTLDAARARVFGNEVPRYPATRTGRLFEGGDIRSVEVPADAFDRIQKERKRAGLDYSVPAVEAHYLESLRRRANAP